MLKKLKIINQKYNQNKKIRMISDKELIKQFKNEVIVPKWVIKDKTNVLFNSFLVKISKITRFFLEVRVFLKSLPIPHIIFHELKILKMNTMSH